MRTGTHIEANELTTADRARGTETGQEGKVWSDAVVVVPALYFNLIFTF